jgi:hypothetical protein
MDEKNLENLYEEFNAVLLISKEHFRKLVEAYDESTIIRYLEYIRKQYGNEEFKLGDIGPCGGIIAYDKGIIGKKGWRYIEVYGEDVSEQLTWGEAIAWSSSLGDGWRLPSLKMLKRLHENKVNIRNMKDNKYWSSTASEYAPNDILCLNFGNGIITSNDVNTQHSVRAVRVF